MTHRFELCEIFVQCT